MIMLPPSLFVCACIFFYLFSLIDPAAPTQAQHHVQPAPDTGSLSASRDGTIFCVCTWTDLLTGSSGSSIVSVSIPQTQLSTRSSLKRARSNSSVNSNYSMYKKSKGKGKARQVVAEKRFPPTAPVPGSSKVTVELLSTLKGKKTTGTKCKAKDPVPQEEEEDTAASAV